ncbi:MAG: TRAP transporter substrate-binding protein [Desulfobacteraceae bacterium]|nr:MAG: TRAP transporter substrate-binding protein [Desulfobacteraceae bacterium]
MKSSRGAILVLCLLVVGLFCFSSPVLAQAKPIELTYSIFFPAPHAQAVLAGEWAKEIEKRTNGQVKITMYYGGTLTPSNQCYDGVVNGLSDIGLSVMAYTRGRFPLSEVLDLPLGFKSGMVATKVANAYVKKMQPKELADTQVMYLHAHGPGLLHTKEPIAKLEDLKGMKISCQGLAAKIVEALGGVPVALPMQDRYDALQKGVAEAGLFPLEALKGWKLAEVVKSTVYNYSSSYSTGFFVVMNKDKWAALPPNIQKVFEAVNGEYIEKAGQTWDKADEVGRTFAVEKGIKFIELSKEESARWAEKVKPLLDGYVKAMKEKGLPGEETLKFCQEEMKKLQK